MTAPTASGRDVIWRLSLLYAATFLMFGVQIPFLPVWLGSRGLNDRDIALVLAAPQFLRVVSTPLVAHWADKSADFLGVLTASLIFNTVLAFTLIFVSGFAPIFVAVTLFSCGPGVVMPLTDTLTFAVLRTFNASRGAGAGRIEYGRVRTWGSAAFVVGNIVAGLFLSIASAAAIPFELAAFGAISIAAAFHAGPMRPLAHAAPHEEEQSPARAPWLLIVVFAAAALIQASHALVNTFGSLHWAREGHSGLYVGAAWAVGVVCETLFFAFGGRWVAGGDRAASFLVLGGATAIVRWFVMAGDPARCTPDRASRARLQLRRHAYGRDVPHLRARAARDARPRARLAERGFRGRRSDCGDAQRAALCVLGRDGLSRHGGPCGGRRRAGVVRRRAPASRTGRRLNQTAGALTMRRPAIRSARAAAFFSLDCSASILPSTRFTSRSALSGDKRSAGALPRP